MSLPPLDELGRKAVDVLWLLDWAYAREKVHLARLPGLSIAPTLRSGGRDSLSKLGAAVGSSMNLGFEAPVDAYLVHGAVNALRGERARLVMERAMIGTPPDWTPEPVIRCEPGATGHVMHIDKRGKRRMCPFRMFSYRGDLAEIVETRRRKYSEWARAIADVHAALAEPGVLVAYTLLAGCPPLAPWD